MGLVSKNYEIERACIHLESRIAEKQAERAREAAMAVDHTPIEELMERQHPKYVPPPQQPSQAQTEITTTTPDHDEDAEAQEQDSPPEPPPQEANNSPEQMEEGSGSDEDDDMIGPQPSE